MKLENFKGSINSQTASKNGHVVVAIPCAGSSERRAGPQPFSFFPAPGAWHSEPCGSDPAHCTGVQSRAEIDMLSP